MRIRRRTNQCLNCGFTLDKVYNYCPNCGQINNDNNVSFFTLAGDFFSTYFALDSTFGRTVKRFFIRPGYLTNRYAEGKRATYAHPLRIYLIMSLFYFFMFSMIGKKMATLDDTPIINAGYEINDVGGLDSTTLDQLKKALPAQALKELNKDLKSGRLEEFQRAFQENVSDKDKERMKSKFNAEQLSLLGFTPDTTQIPQVVNKKSAPVQKKKQSENTADGDDDESIFDRLEWGLIEDLKDDKSYSDKDVLDSMKLGELSAFDKYMAMQSIRVIRTDKERFIEFMIKNLPLMMFILIPIFALILKLIYIRHKKELYIKHLIHALHLHSFAYFFYGLGLIAIFHSMDEDVTQAVGFIGFFIVSIYAYISFLKVYRQHWFKTLIKFNAVGFIYIFCIFFFFVFEMVISLLIY